MCKFIILILLSKYFDSFRWILYFLSFKILDLNSNPFFYYNFKGFYWDSQ